jgi:membrane-associated phospholipid phosphatase
MMPELVESLLVSGWPQSTQLTSEVNVNTNVFPSLHTSLSVTVALLAYRTRRIYPEWLAISVPLAGSVALATMYLGIHWATDVVVGAALAGGSVWIATRVNLPQDRDQLRDRAATLRSRVRRTRRTLRRGWSRRRSR